MRNTWQVETAALLNDELVVAGALVGGVRLRCVSVRLRDCLLFFLRFQSFALGRFARLFPVLTLGWEGGGHGGVSSKQV